MPMQQLLCLFKIQSTTSHLPVEQVLVCVWKENLLCLPAFIWMLFNASGQGSRKKKTDFKGGLCTVYAISAY